MGNLGWQDWSAYNDSSIWVANRVVPGKDRLEDTWHGAVGAQYQLNPVLRLNAGIAYDTSFYDSQDDTSLTMPSWASWRFGAGVQYALDKLSSLAGSFEYLTAESSSVPSTLLNGSYDTTQLYFLALNYTCTF